MQRWPRCGNSQQGCGAKPRLVHSPLNKNQSRNSVECGSAHRADCLSGGGAGNRGAGPQLPTAAEVDAVSRAFKAARKPASPAPTFRCNHCGEGAAKVIHLPVACGLLLHDSEEFCHVHLHMNNTLRGILWQLLRCGRCKSVSYCGKSCQQAAWSALFRAVLY